MIIIKLQYDNDGKANAPMKMLNFEFEPTKQIPKRDQS